MSVLGLDLGGSGAKALVFDPLGNVLVAAKVDYGPVSPRQGQLEFDPNHQWDALSAVTRRVAVAAHEMRDPIRAIGISVAGEAVLPVDRHGRPLHNSIATPDGRGKEQIARLEMTLGAERIYQITGQPLDVFYSLPRVLWFRDALPEIFARTWKFLLWHEYVLVRLGLAPSLDYPNASRTMALDIRSGEWSSEILGCAGIDADLFAPLARPGSVAGTLGAHVADALGLERGTLVAVGGFDQCCAAVGVGAIGDLEASVGTGSVEALVLSLRMPPLTEHLRKGMFAVCPNVTPDSFVLIGTSFAAGSLVRWFVETMAPDLLALARLRGQSAFELALGSLPEQPSRLLVLPHLNGAFSPVRDPCSKAAIIGLRQDTTRTEIARAILEGTAFELRAMLDYVEGVGLRPLRLRASGGGARSPAWLQIKADVLGRTIEVPAVQDAACLGAAMLATVALDGERDIAQISREMVRIGSIVEPDPARAAVYDERYVAYRELYPATAALHRAL